MVYSAVSATVPVLAKSLACRYPAAHRAAARYFWFHVDDTMIQLVPSFCGVNTIALRTWQILICVTEQLQVSVSKFVLRVLMLGFL